MPMYNNITHIISGFIIVVSFIFAGYLIGTDILSERLYGTKRTVFISMLLVYGCYRTYRLYVTLKTQKQ